MKRLLSAAVVFLAACLVAAAQFRSPLDALDDSETVHSLRSHVEYLASAALEGRAPGSEGEKDAAAYVAEKLREYGIDVLQDQEFGLRKGADTLVSRNVVGFLQGWDADLRDRYIVIGARLDNLGTDSYTVDGEIRRRIYYGANGNASGLSMLLELAGKLSYARSLVRRSILFVGFGASGESLAGSWYFLERAFSDADKIDAMVNLDMLGLPENGLQAYSSSNEDLDTIVKTLRGELLPIRADVTAEEPYTGDHRAFYNKEIPSVLFTTGRYPEHGTGRDTPDLLDYDGMEKELEYIYSFTVRLCNGQKPLFRSSSAKEEVPEGAFAYSDVDIKPMFLNSPSPSAFLEKWVYQYLKYPRYAMENGIQGRVLVSFTVDEKGDVKDVTVTRGVHDSLDAEAVRVVSASPRWRPGRRAGKKVRTVMTVAIDFRLEKNKSKFGINGKTL